MSSNIREVRTELLALKAEMQVMKREMRTYRSMLQDVFALSDLLGLKGVSSIRQHIILLYQLKAAYDAVQLARMAAGDPLAWISAGVTVTATVASAVDMAGCFG